MTDFSSSPEQSDHEVEDQLREFVAQHEKEKRLEFERWFGRHFDELRNDSSIIESALHADNADMIMWSLRFVCEYWEVHKAYEVVLGYARQDASLPIKRMATASLGLIYTKGGDSRIVSFLIENIRNESLDRLTRIDSYISLCTVERALEIDIEHRENFDLENDVDWIYLSSLCE